jgi:beta-galactosidase
LNGKHLLNHKSRFLPFDIDVTADAFFGSKICLLIRLSNKDNPDIPSGKPIKDPDFNFMAAFTAMPG